MTYDKITIHTKTGEHLASFNDVFRSLADVRQRVANRCNYKGTVQVAAYSADTGMKSFNMRLKTR